MENKKIFIIHFKKIEQKIKGINLKIYFLFCSTLWPNLSLLRYKKVGLVQYLTYPNNLFHRGAKVDYDFG